MDKTVCILDPEGREIELPLWAVVKLQQAKFLYRDQETRRKRIKQAIYGWIELFRGADPTRPQSRREHPLLKVLDERRASAWTRQVLERRAL